MTIFLYANNAKSALAGSITDTAVTANLTSGSGVLFPNPSAGQQFALTFVDAATGLLREIVYVTARSGDTITMVRGQEGTTALNWSAGDIAASLVTAGNMTSALQPGQISYIRTRLLTNTTFYVNASTGNNVTGDGSIGNPWQTLQFAYDWIAENVDLVQWTTTLNITGSFTAGLDCSTVIPGAVQSKDFNGVPNLRITTSSSASIAATSGFCLIARNSNSILITGNITVSGSGACLGGLAASGGGIIGYDGLTFGSFPAAASHVLIETGGYISVNGDYSITGGCSFHIRAVHAAVITFGALTVTLTGTPDFPGSFVSASFGSTIDTSNGSGTNVTFSGGATGPRYSAQFNAVIYTVSGGANYFPGNSAGTTATGGQYA